MPRKKNTLRATTLTAALWLAGLPATAFAVIPPDAGSANRPRPEYDPIGLHLGGFYLNPSISLETDYLDNIYATDTNRQGDVIFDIRPQLELRSGWSRHAVAAKAYVDRTILGKYTSENGTDFGGELAGKIDVSRATMLRLSASGDRRSEDRSSIDAIDTALRPIRYTQLSARASIDHTLNRFAFTLSGDIQKFKYTDGMSLAGVVDQQYRDHRTLTGTVQGTYLFRPGYRALVRISANDRQYDLRPGKLGFDPRFDFDRASHGYRIEAGVDFELTDLLYGNIRGGVLKQSFRDVRLQDVSGWSAGADLLWDITTLTTLRLNFDRRVDDTSSTITAGRLVSEVALGLDHELLRNLILSLDGRKSWLDYQGLARNDKDNQIDFNVRYLMNRAMVLNFQYTYLKRSSVLASENFRSNGVGLKLQLSL